MASDYRPRSIIETDPVCPACGGSLEDTIISDHNLIVAAQTLAYLKEIIEYALENGLSITDGEAALDAIKASLNLVGLDSDMPPPFPDSDE